MAEKYPTYYYRDLIFSEVKFHRLSWWGGSTIGRVEIPHIKADATISQQTKTRNETKECMSLFDPNFPTN